VSEVLPRTVGAEPTVLAEELLDFLVPNADHLRSLLFECHPPQQVGDTLSGCKSGVEITRLIDSDVHRLSRVGQ
jgi:hypothetical protein